MRAIICLLAMVAMAQPASACALDGMYGAHRFNPFQGMHIELGDQLSDAASDQAGEFDRNIDPADNTTEPGAELAKAKSEFDELPRY